MTFKLRKWASISTATWVKTSGDTATGLQVMARDLHCTAVAAGAIGWCQTGQYPVIEDGYVTSSIDAGSTVTEYASKRFVYAFCFQANIASAKTLTLLKNGVVSRIATTTNVVATSQTEVQVALEALGFTVHEFFTTYEGSAYRVVLCSHDQLFHSISEYLGGPRWTQRRDTSGPRVEGGPAVSQLVRASLNVAG